MRRWLAVGVLGTVVLAAGPTLGARGTRPGVAPSASAPLRKLKAGPHMEIRARDVRLTEDGMAKLRRIAARYHEATRRQLVITGGTRTPQRQAELMVEKLVHDEDIVGLYEHRQAAAEVRKAYAASREARLPHRQIVRAVREVIERQVARGVFVSKHLRAGAIDVRSRGMSQEHEHALRTAIAEERGVTLVDERGSAEPHFHLSL